MRECPHCHCLTVEFNIFSGLYECTRRDCRYTAHPKRSGGVSASRRRVATAGTASLAARLSNLRHPSAG